MHTVIETPAYLAMAKDEGMTPEERQAAIDAVAENPTVGELIVGSGGCRKLRIGGKGKGKRGGYRLVTFYANEHVPAFLLAVLAKGSKSNFSDAQVKAMAKATTTLVASLGPRAVG